MNVSWDLPLERGMHGALRAYGIRLGVLGVVVLANIVLAGLVIVAAWLSPAILLASIALVLSLVANLVIVLRARRHSSTAWELDLAQAERVRQEAAEVRTALKGRLEKLERRGSTLEESLWDQRAAQKSTELELGRTLAALGLLLSDQGRYAQAREHLARALEIEERHLQPDHAEVIRTRTNFSALLIGLGEYAEATQQLSRVIELNPGSVWAIRLRGQAYLSLRRFEEALADFTRATYYYPNSPLLIALRGRTYQAMGRLEEALDDLNRAIDLDANLDAATFTARGKIHSTMGHYKEALADFTRATHLYPDDPEAYAAFVLRGQTYQAMGRLQEAQHDLNQVISIGERDLGYDQHQVAIARTVLGSILIELGHPSAAVEQLERAMEFFRGSMKADSPEIKFATSLLAKLNPNG
jgi:tetratricopeptide (TPR) repeat protein